jgi:hypothetical protein
MPSPFLISAFFSAAPSIGTSGQAWLIQLNSDTFDWGVIDSHMFLPPVNSNTVEIHPLPHGKHTHTNGESGEEHTDAHRQDTVGVGVQ